MRNKILSALSLALLPLAAAAQQDAGPASKVNPLVGTAPNPTVKVGWSFDTGNVFPGAVCPRGMIAWSPDTTHSRQIAGGYWYPDNKIEEFSLTHFSGRGVPCLKDVGFMPVIQEVSASPGTAWASFASTYTHENETATPAFYRVKFDNGVETQLTTSLRAGLGSFQFPSQSPASLLIRADGTISVKGSEVSGYASARVGKGGAYKVYFTAQFEHAPKSVKTWVGGKLSDSSDAEGASSGAVLTFDTSAEATVRMRVGISYTSQANARENLEKEITGWDQGEVKKAGINQWNKALNCVKVEGGTDDQQKVFYTALYHCFMHPNILDDDNGQYIGMDQKVHSVEAGHHQYQNIPAWDEHRSHTPLMAILTPKDSADVMQSLVNYAEQDRSIQPQGGGLPRWEQVNRNSGGMVGDGDDQLIAYANAFGVTQFDTKAALEAMDRGASIPDITSDGRKVRGGLPDYLSLGYVPGSAAITLEYCNDDFALAQFAKSLGDQAKYETYLKRSSNWKKLFDSETGYIRPRTADGKFDGTFSPRNGKGFIEGSAAQYFWMVNFDEPGLIKAMGGNEKAIARLDEFFSKLNGGLASPFAYMGNEPCEETPWVYDFAAHRGGHRLSFARQKTNCSQLNLMEYPGTTMLVPCRHGMYFLRWGSIRISQAWPVLWSAAPFFPRRPSS